MSSACGAMYNAYSCTKDSVPLLKGVMEVAESGAHMLGAAASTGSKPILDRLEPQSKDLSLRCSLCLLCLVFYMCSCSYWFSNKDSCFGVLSLV